MKRFILSLGVIASMFLLSGCIFDAVPVISSEQDYYYIEINEEFDLRDYITVTDRQDTKVPFGYLDIDYGDFDISVLGVYDITITATDTDDNTTTKTITFEVVDTEAPTALYDYYDVIIFDFGEEISFPSFRCEDNSGECSIDIEQNINTDELGEYDISYIVTDPSGNEIILDFIVEINDVTGPEILYYDATTVYVNFNETYKNLDIECEDNYDEFCMIEVDGSVDTSVFDEYQIVYTATDSHNNVSTLTITVVVRDNVIPEVTLNGEEEVVIYSLEDYVELGITTTDNLDAVDDLRIIINSELEEGISFGTYYIDYTVIDTAGNANAVRRTVIYKDSFEDFCVISDYQILIDTPVQDVVVQDCEDYTYQLNYSVNNLEEGNYEITLEIFSDGVLVRTKIANYAVLDYTTDLMNLNVFVRFNDETSYQSPYHSDYYYDLLNGDISVRDYFLEVSHGSLVVDSVFANDVNSFYTDMYDRGYYQPHGPTNPDGYKTEEEAHDREQLLIGRIVEYIDDNELIDDSINLDIDDDGYVDSMTVFFSGDQGDWNDLLWPHAWAFFYYMEDGYPTVDNPTINGDYVYDYNVEFLGHIQNHPDNVNIGVLVHEIFHLIGAEDYYHYYNDTEIEPVGDWDVMEGGSFYEYPPHMLNYTKEQYAGLDLDNVIIEEDGLYTINRSSMIYDNNGFITLNHSNEVLYIEYRTNSSVYEDSINEEGLIVYRVDYDYRGFGNSDGFYNALGDARDEVFVFRPIRIDQSLYNTTGEIDVVDYLYVSEAAMNFDSHTSMGYGTEVQMFYSDFSEIKITITLVEMTEDYVVIDVDFIE